MITSVNEPSQATVTQSGNNLTIDNISSANNFSFTISIRDEAGQSGTTTVFVNVSAPLVEANDDQFQTIQDQEVSGNVLMNDVGENLEVTEFTQPNDGSVNITGAGNLTFTPNQGFTGTATLNYTITGACDITRTATVTIDVGSDDCMGDISVEDTPAACGEENGSANITVTPSGAYDFDWSNGASGASQSDLAPGSYSVTVTGQDENCREVIEVVIEEDPLNLDVNIETTPTNCGSDNGTADVSISTPGEFEYAWSNG